MQFRIPFPAVLLNRMRDVGDYFVPFAVHSASFPGAASRSLQDIPKAGTVIPPVLAARSHYSVQSGLSIRDPSTKPDVSAS